MRGMRGFRHILIVAFRVILTLFWEYLMIIKIGMLCTAQGRKYPATASVHANDLGTARVFAETYAKLDGADSVEFPTDWYALPHQWQQWFMQHGVLSF